MKYQSCRVIEAENSKQLAEIRSRKRETVMKKEAEAYDVQQR